MLLIFSCCRLVLSYDCEAPASIVVGFVLGFVFEGSIRVDVQVDHGCPVTLPVFCERDYLQRCLCCLMEWVGRFELR